MGTTVCLFSNAIDYPDGGGHVWEYLNWALGFHALGCRVVWLERVGRRSAVQKVRANVVALKRRLERYGLSGERLALVSKDGRSLPKEMGGGCLDLEAAAGADLLVNLAYDIPPKMVKRFRRSVLVDVDPGLAQIWISEGQVRVPRHDVYFTTGETVGQPGARFPDCGLQWHFTPPAVSLTAWPVAEAHPSAPYTTITHWWGGEWVVFGRERYSNSKREGFLPFLDLPHHTPRPLELAVRLAKSDGGERAMLREWGWRLRDPAEVASTPWDYRRYIQNSRGEFTCVKPSCVRLQNAWIGDRTICYLASGKPAVVQHTGPSRFLPDAGGLFRCRNVKEAAHAVDAVEADYTRHCRLARALAEEYFDARKVASGVLERALA